MSYLTPNTAQLIISNVSCAVDPGERWPSSARPAPARARCAGMLVGLAIPDAGEIRIDGSQIHHWDGEQIGRHVGFLPQDVELFAGSVRDNIARMQVRE